MIDRMYKDAKSWSPFVGCEFNCIYCQPSFQRQMKRMKCELCRQYKPHYHPERLRRLPPGNLIFAIAFGDIAFGDTACAMTNVFGQIVQVVMKEHSAKTFMMQSKSPAAFWWQDEYPANVVLGTTIETNRTIPRKISLAPHPADRVIDLRAVRHSRKYITVEPIMDFDLPQFIEMVESIVPEFVYIGYDSHNCGLPEPPIEKTLELINRLKLFAGVRVKTLKNGQKGR